MNFLFVCSKVNMVTMAVTLIGVERNASSTKFFDKTREKAYRDEKIGVINFHTYRSSQTPL
jgi:hypothetical protein